jgi:tRNA A-37 threonylcarbamoyl transferase component Bud32
MGVVYLAEHPVIGRKVALKAIHPELSRNPEVVSRFITEAKAVNQVGNEHIVDIHDFGTTPEGEFYFIMEYLQGESLADRLRRERVFVPSRALQIASQVADALAASHGHGIIHRDLKPENIFLINRGNSVDFVKVLDFGLAKLMQSEEKVTHKTRTGSVMGTPYYMAPEQCEGKSSLDQRADLYSLGVILFEMLTGRVPFTGEGYGEIIVKHITQPPPPPRSLNPGLTPGHEAILMRALAKNREDRFASMQEMRAAMLDPERYLAGAPALPTMPTMMASPVGMRADDVSGELVFGHGPDVRPGVHDAPLPSTFRHAGEVDDDYDKPARSRRGLLLAAVVAGALAAGGAVFLFNKQGPSPDAAGVDHGKAAALKPATTTIRFASRPDGARVLRKGSDETLGITPFELTIPSGKEMVEFVFRRPGYEESVVSLVPDSPATTLPVTLTAERPAPPAEKPPVAPPAPAALPSPTTAEKPPATHQAPRTRPTAPKPARHTPRPVNDEDGVLEPSFR